MDSAGIGRPAESPEPHRGSQPYLEGRWRVGMNAKQILQKRIKRRLLRWPEEWMADDLKSNIHRVGQRWALKKILKWLHSGKTVQQIKKLAQLLKIKCARMLSLSLGEPWPRHGAHTVEDWGNRWTWAGSAVHGFLSSLGKVCKKKRGKKPNYCVLLCHCSCPRWGQPDEDDIWDCDCSCGNKVHACGLCLREGRVSECRECSKKRLRSGAGDN